MLDAAVSLSYSQSGASILMQAVNNKDLKGQWILSPGTHTGCSCKSAIKYAFAVVSFKSYWLHYNFFKGLSDNEMALVEPHACKAHCCSVGMRQQVQSFCRHCKEKWWWAGQGRNNRDQSRDVMLLGDRARTCHCLQQWLTHRYEADKKAERLRTRHAKHKKRWFGDLWKQQDWIKNDM